jgi:DNA repair exonuclease SbcCD ATPase subunit
MVDINEEDIKKMEAEIKVKQLEQEQVKKKEIETLLDEAVSKGKDAALKTFEAEAEKKRLEEERTSLLNRQKELEDEMKKTQEAASKKIEELSKQVTEKLQELDARPKGISRNDSPFNSAAPSKSSIQGLSLEEKKGIEKASMESFYTQVLGRVPPQ